MGKYYQERSATEAEESGLGLTHGFIDVEHTDETMKRCADKRGSGDNKINLYYETSRKVGEKSEKEHIVFLHATGTTASVYRIGNRDHHLVGLFLDKGFDITSFDLRGHGLTSVPQGPYTIELLAADIAEALMKLFPDEKFHIYGTSVGYGTAMAFALDYPQITKTLLGSGFLFDRTRKDFAAWFFSRPRVIKMLGMRTLAKATQMAIKVQTKGPIIDQMRHIKMEGYIHVASAWLQFNRKPDLPNHNVPTLIIVPQYDENIGHKRKYYEQEMALMPPDVAEMWYVPTFSHAMLFETNKKGQVGAQLITNKVIEFINQRTGTNI